MPRHDPSPDPRPEIAGVVALLREDRESLVARIAELSADMDALFEASRDSNADDEHDGSGHEPRAAAGGARDDTTGGLALAAVV